MVTMQDVARAAGVSPMTVSNVVNARPHVKPETKKRVLAAINELGYRVNAAGRSLRTGRTGTIGFAVPEVDNQYFAHLIGCVVDEAAQQGMRVAIEQTDAMRETEIEVVSTSRNRLYDGLLLSTAGLTDADTALLQVDYPIVLLGESLFDAPLDHIVMPNFDGAREATEHLIAQGSRRIAYLRRPDTELDPRREGYLEAIARVGLEPILIEVEGLDIASGARAVGAALSQGLVVDAIAAFTDNLAIGAVRGAADAGLRVPDDLRVTGFDNVPLAALSVPSLTTIAPDHSTTAHTAVTFLLERMAGSTVPPRTFTIPHTLIVRESSTR
ncbi:LacI family transcriptional regulator [Microbacterium nanhaiense]|uniref:LacI family transcriptional regulator n=1 Tax=Microbacterium nanhaiense TaxID=1301026 RepID=A0ABQ2N353_9MICO|nr:LacI family DNA-binding transcriptional regulator [Microbacterium nanhaiense]GGO64909.1 LacI family transcriptional regulator [Microbacterium nanhaiense]